MLGLELARRFYFEAVRPILDRRFPEVEHAAALIGWGSEVLGLDDERSQDHQWGARLQLFVPDETVAPAIGRGLADELPREVAGFPTGFGPTDEPGTLRLAASEDGPVRHLVETVELGAYLRERIGVDPRDGLSAADWVATPSQRLLELTAGAVFADPIGDLTRVRERLGWYPHDVWLVVMAGHWRRIAQFEHLHGRAAMVGDELGSRVLAAALVRDLMRLGLLQSRRYPPYPKWLGTAYARLGLEEEPALCAALTAEEPAAREDALVAAYEAVARRHNGLGVTDAVDPTVRPFWTRPIRVLFADRFVDALAAAIDDPEVAALDHLLGSIDAVSDNTDVLSRPDVWRRLAGVVRR